MHAAQLHWYVDTLRAHALNFCADDHLDDLAMRRVWATHIGRTRLACTLHEFMSAMTAALSTSSSSSSPVSSASVRTTATTATHAYTTSAPSSLPAWLQALLTRIVDYTACGVVSVFDVQRLLRVWGPLPLLVHNMSEEARSGVFCFAQLYDVLRVTLPQRPDARVGDFAAALTERPGDVRIVLLVRDDDEKEEDNTDEDNNKQHHHRHRRHHRHRSSGSANEGSMTDAVQQQPSSSPRVRLTTRTHYLTHEGGAWALNGIVREELTSVRHACALLADTLRRPCGEYLVVDTDNNNNNTTDNSNNTSDGSSDNKSSPATTTRRPSWPPTCTTATTTAMTTTTSCAEVYALHYACYRNNRRYVQTLLRRGAGTIVNCAVSDTMWSAQQPAQTQQHVYAQQQLLHWTPLLCAVNNTDGDCADVLQMLLDAGADATYVDESGSTALYYAIVNGYAGATRVLLLQAAATATAATATATMMTSPTTLPLLLALGAHDFHLRASDVRRAAEVVPSRGVIEALMPYTHDYALLSLAIALLRDKLAGVDRACDVTWRRQLRARAADIAAAAAGLPRDVYESSDEGIAACGGGGSHCCNDKGDELRSVEEQATVRALVRAHTRLCQRNARELLVVCNVMAQRCYVLSWHAWLRQLRHLTTTTTTATAADRENNSCSDADAEEAALVASTKQQQHEDTSDVH